jgi:hypothetical protein
VGRISLRGIGSVAEARAHIWCIRYDGGPGVEGDAAVHEFYFIDFHADILRLGKLANAVM